MSRILLIRHAQSANNALAEYLRVCDPGLTPLGERQATKLATTLKNYSIDRLFCSPFRRSLETTRPIAESLEIYPEIRSDLFEQGGCYSGYLPGQERGELGMGRDELSARFPGWLIDARIGTAGWWGKPYESEFQAIQRASAVRTWLEGQTDLRHDGLDALVIHADFERLLLIALLGEQAFGTGSRLDAPVANASLTLLEYRAQGKLWAGTDRNSRRWTILSFNATDHLDPDEISV